MLLVHIEYTGLYLHLFHSDYFDFPFSNLKIQEVILSFPFFKGVCFTYIITLEYRNAINTIHEDSFQFYLLIAGLKFLYHVLIVFLLYQILTVPYYGYVSCQTWGWDNELNSHL